MFHYVCREEADSETGLLTVSETNEASQLAASKEMRGAACAFERLYVARITPAPYERLEGASI